MDSVKSVLTVLVVLSCSVQFLVQLHTSLIVFCMQWTAVVVCSSAHHTAKSSACRVFDTCRGTVVVIPFIQIRKRIGYTTPPCGIPSFSFTSLLIIPSTFTLAVLLKRKSLSHLYILPCTPTRESFSSSPYFQTLSKAFDRSKENCQNLLLLSEGISVSCVFPLFVSSLSSLSACLLVSLPISVNLFTDSLHFADCCG